MPGRGRAPKKRARRDAIQPYELRFDVRRNLAPDGGPEDYFVHIEATISLRTHDGAMVAGEVHACLIEAERAFDDGEDIVLACDEEGDGLEDLCVDVFGEDGWLRDGVSDGCDRIDVLFLRQATVAREHRGKGLGLAAVLRVIETFGRACAVAVMKPFPLQLSCGRDRIAEDEGFEADAALAHASLQRHWKKLGFTRLGETELFVMDLQAERPRFEDLFQG